MANGFSETIRRVVPYRLRHFLRNGRPRFSPGEDAQVEIQQLKDIVRREHGLPVAPPKALQVRILGLYSPHFIESGWQTFEVFQQSLARFGCAIESCETVLDFGCGCGRVIRAFRQMSPRARLYGTDIDGEAIQWLSENYQQFGTFSRNGELPPFAFGDDSFDLIYSISVFTHLPENMQLAWLEELRRVCKPGAFVLTTAYDQNRHLVLNSTNRKVFADTGFCYIHENVSTTEGLPAFYQTAFHSHDYIRRVWGTFFEVVHIEPLGMDGHSDLVILRKPL
jgi:ubiquinone/menaquinone biosynthesis C-methylase UbiE